MGIRNTPLNRFAISNLPVFFPIIIITIELAIWATLMRYGYTEAEWTFLRVVILLAFGVVCFAGVSFFDSGTYGIQTTAIFVLMPWFLCALLIAICALVTFGFDFLTLAWFFYPFGASIVSLLVAALIENEYPNFF